MIFTIWPFTEKVCRPLLSINFSFLSVFLNRKLPISNVNGNQYFLPWKAAIKSLWNYEINNIPAKSTYRASGSQAVVHKTEGSGEGARTNSGNWGAGYSTGKNVERKKRKV